MRPKYKSVIAKKIKETLESVSTENGYSHTIRTVNFDRIKLNISGYDKHQYPVAQVIDFQKSFSYKHGFSDSTWTLGIELAIRKNSSEIVDQSSIWDLQEDVASAFLRDPRLGLDFVKQVRLLDEATDLLLSDDEYTSVIGLAIEYNESLRV